MTQRRIPPSATAFPLVPYLLLLGLGLVVLMILAPDTLFGLGVGVGVVLTVLAFLWLFLWILNWFLQRSSRYQREPTWSDIYWQQSTMDSWAACHKEHTDGCDAGSNTGNCDDGRSDGGGGDC